MSSLSPTHIHQKQLALLAAQIDELFARTVQLSRRLFAGFEGCAGVQKRRCKPWAPSETKAAVRRLKAGESVQSVAASLGRSHTAVQRQVATARQYKKHMRRCRSKLRSLQVRPDDFSTLRVRALASVGFCEEGIPIQHRPPELAPQSVGSGARTSERHRCGGHLLLACLRLAYYDLRMPVVPMAGGDGVAFLGYALTHGTLPHHALEERLHGCEAHISLAVQTSRHLLGISAKERDQLDVDMCRLAAIDAKELSGAVWMEVIHDEAQTVADVPERAFEFDSSTMFMLPHKAPVVLFSRHRCGAVRVLLVYVPEAAEAVAGSMRFNFSQLSHFRFSLRRTAWHLGTDGNAQPMLMVGARVSKPNEAWGKRPTWADPKLWKDVVNAAGDVDVYANTRNHKDSLYGVQGRPIWDGVSASMKDMLPRVCRFMRVFIEGSKLPERAYTRNPIDFTNGVLSSDGLVNNAGISSAYASALHRDQHDVGFTFAFAGKCPAGP